MKLGKENIFVWENDETKFHENDAAEILKNICQGENLSASEVKEGKIELAATCDGVFCVDAEKLNTVNDVSEICIATLQNNIPVKKGKKFRECALFRSLSTKKKCYTFKKSQAIRHY